MTTTTPPTRALPTDPAAEAAALGAILLSGRLAEQALPLLRPEHFAVPWHRDVLAAAQRVLEARQPVDPITVHDALRRVGIVRLGGAGAGIRLAELVEAPPTAGSGMHYVGIVLDHAARRRLAQAGDRLTQLAGNGSGDLDELMRHAVRELACVRAAVDAHHRAVPARDGPDPAPQPPVLRAVPDREL